MRSVGQHLNQCLNLISPLMPLDVLLPDAVGCVLAESITAEVDIPVVDQATIDGYAIYSGDILGASFNTPVVLPVCGEIRAGEINPVSLAAQTAYRIASGAPLPPGADTVIPLEYTDQGLEQVQVLKLCRAGANILRRGQDVRAGETVLEAKTRIGSRQIAMLAGIGRQTVKVHPKPRVVIVSIGDELIEPGQTIRPGSVFDANGHALSSAVADARADTFRVAAVPDERRALSDALEDQLVRADIIITTGGLSYGSGDTVREVLAPLGTTRFDQVAMTPGKQLGSGTIGHGVPIFCLPGNPVAAHICYEIFVRPCLRHLAGSKHLHRGTLRAKVKQEWKSPAGRREFVPARILGRPDCGYEAEIMGDPEELLLSNLVKANALAVIPEEVTSVKAGDYFTCMLLE